MPDADGDRRGDLGTVRASIRNELAIRRGKGELEYRARNLDLEVARRRQEESKKARGQAVKQMDAQRRLRLLEKEQHVDQLCRQIADLKRSADRG